MQLFKTYLSLVIILTVLWLNASFTAVAQEASVPMTVSVSSLEARIESLQNLEGLTEEQLDLATSLYKEAQTRLKDIVSIKEEGVTYTASLETLPGILDVLSEDIETAKSALDVDPKTAMNIVDDEPMRENDLMALEQELSLREGQLQALRSEVEGYRDRQEELSQRQVSAPEDLNRATEELRKIIASLADIGEGELEPVNQARRINLRVKETFRRSQIDTLEIEIESLPRRLEAVMARQNLVDFKLQKLSREVKAIQEKTGQRRLNEALQLQIIIREQGDLYGTGHPALRAIAERNTVLAEQIRDITADEFNISRQTAASLSQADNVAEDLKIAKDLTDLDSLDREAGATLRRLGSKLESTQSIKSSLNKTESQLVNATRQRLIALEELRNLPLGRPDPDQVLSQARQEDATLPDFTEKDIQSLQILSDTRRSLLARVTSEGVERITDIRQLQVAQTNLLEITLSLETLLDETLLWIPSVPAIGLDWAPKIVDGAFELFSIDHFKLAGRTLIEQMMRLWPLFLLLGAIITLLYRMRPTMWEKVRTISGEVGRVKYDKVTHTPLAAGLGLLIALPLPLVFLFFGLVFLLADTADPFIDGLKNSFLYLSVFTLILFSWRVWDNEGSLFGKHFKMQDGFRRTIDKELKWFIPSIAVSSGLLALTTDISSENIYEGLSLFIFILTTFILAVFAFKIIWMSEGNANEATAGFILRHKGIASLFLIGGPIGAAILAAAGYYETADALLWRFFTSCVLILGTYVLWATIRRVITVTQRQIKYRQAVEKRDAAIKARKEKAEAEERGEEVTPPPLDTQEIDVLSMTRQSSKLLNTLIIIAFAALLWMNWSSLMPALTMFDSFQLGSYVAGQDETGKDIIKAVTLWSLIQALVILVFTFIAAKNLPGFLEIFVLDKLGVDAGTRYAIVTILGYIIVAAGVIIGFDRLGLQWSQLKFVAAGLSVGIGFGLQKIIANFVSGLIILFERPVRIGDYVTIGDQSGTVSRIKIRATTLSDLDNREILIPNEALISERVTNWTLSNSVTRLIVKVGVAYGSDTEKAKELMMQTIKSMPKVLENPPPQVLFMGFGDSSLDFQLRVFLRSFDDRVPMTHAIHTEINKTLSTAGISIPFPQVDLNIVSQNMPLRVDGQKAPTKRKPSTKPKGKPKTS